MADLDLRELLDLLDEARRVPLEDAFPELEVGASVVPDGDKPGLFVLQTRQEGEPLCTYSFVGGETDKAVALEVASPLEQAAKRLLVLLICLSDGGLKPLMSPMEASNRSCPW